MIPPFLFKLPISKIKVYADKYSIPWELIASICMQESAGDANAIRYEPRWQWGLFHVHAFANSHNISIATETMLQKCSYGLTQTMGVVAREMGFKGPLVTLLDPDTNLDIGCRKIKELMLRYSEQSQVIAAYNAGSPRKRAGMYVNQRYVDSVWQKLEQIRKLM
jgi:hypothetical protein